MAPEIELASAVEADTARDTNHRAVGAAAGGATAVANTDTAQPSEPMPSHPPTSAPSSHSLSGRQCRPGCLGMSSSSWVAASPLPMPASVGPQHERRGPPGVPSGPASQSRIRDPDACRLCDDHCDIKRRNRLHLPSGRGGPSAIDARAPVGVHGAGRLTTSLAFVLPGSTPPNAMAFASGRLEVRDMVGLGLCMNVVGIVAIFIWINTIGIAIFGLGGDQVPAMWRMSNISSH